MVIMYILFAVCLVVCFPFAFGIMAAIKEAQQKHWEDYVNGRIKKL